MGLASVRWKALLVGLIFRLVYGNQTVVGKSMAWEQSAISETETLNVLCKSIQTN